MLVIMLLSSYNRCQPQQRKAKSNLQAENGSTSVRQSRLETNRGRTRSVRCAVDRGDFEPRETTTLHPAATADRSAVVLAKVSPET